MDEFYETEDLSSGPADPDAGVRSALERSSVS
jgi:hypothetical protein